MAEERKDAETRGDDTETGGDDGKARRGDGESRSEVIQRRISAVVILLVIAVVIMAIADAPPFFDDVTDEERVSDVVEEFFAAVEDRDAAAACDLFSESVVRSIELAGATETKQGELRKCAEILEARFAAEDEEGEPPKYSIKIESVRVSGQRAVAEVILKTAEQPKGRSVPVELERSAEGDWLITRQVITS